MKKYWPAIVWVLGFQVVSSVIGMTTRANMDWYRGLEKSSFNPPDLAFPIVWTALYVLLALAAYQMWNVRKLPQARVPFILFWAQMIMNWAWSFVFFEFQAVELAFYWIVALDVLMLMFIASALKIVPKAAFLVFPTVLWGSFAAFLNYMIWILN